MGFSSSYWIFTALAALWACTCVSATTAPMMCPTHVTFGTERSSMNCSQSHCPICWTHRNTETHRPVCRQGRSRHTGQVQSRCCLGCQQQTNSTPHQACLQQRRCLWSYSKQTHCCVRQVYVCALCVCVALSQFRVYIL